MPVGKVGNFIQKWEESDMTKKFLSTVLLAAMVLSLVSGCSLFATDSGKETAGAGSGTEPVKFTDKFTFENPADLDFDTRYVIHCGKDSAVLSNIPEEYGITDQYIIVFAKEDAVVGSYEYYVCATEEHGQKVLEFLSSQGYSVSPEAADPAVLGDFSDKDTMEAALISMQSMGVISEATASAYVDLMKAQYGGELLS